MARHTHPQILEFKKLKLKKTPIFWTGKKIKPGNCLFPTPGNFVIINQRMTEPVADPITSIPTVNDAYVIINALPLDERVNAGVLILENAIKELNLKANKIKRDARKSIATGKNELKVMTSPTPNIKNLDQSSTDLRSTGASFKDSMNTVLKQISDGTANADLKDNVDAFCYDNTSVSSARTTSVKLLEMYSLFVQEKAMNAEIEFNKVKRIVSGHENSLFTINETLQTLVSSIEDYDSVSD